MSQARCQETGKIPLTRELAQRIAEERRPRRVLDKGRHLNAYRCRHCQQWHVGGINRQRKPSRALARAIANEEDEG
jgi:hypothetical protein